MSHQSVKWGQVKRYFESRDYVIYGSGGDKIISAPKDGAAERTRQTVLIGHRFCGHAGDEVSPGYIRQIERAFGVTREQLLKG